MFEQLDSYYKSLNYECPNCKSKQDAIPCVFGRPSPQLVEYAAAGYAKLLGCCPEPNGEGKYLKAYCKKCDLDIFL
jgi:hypothetical protein